MNEPRDYEYVQLSGSHRENVSADRLHDHRSDNLYTGILRGQFITRSYVHVGTGQLMRPSELEPKPEGTGFRLVSPFYRGINQDGELARLIPGSSFRGLLRSLVEIITPSSFGITKGTSPDKNLSPTNSVSATDQDLMPQKAKPYLDPAAQLFGVEGYASHLRFYDVTTINLEPWDIIAIKDPWGPKVTQPNAHKIYLHKDDYNEGNTILEACPAGIEWSFEIAFHNLLSAQIGILLIALGQKPDEPIYPKLGGGKSQGLGSIEITSVEVERENTYESFLTYDAPEPQRWTKSDRTFQAFIQDAEKNLLDAKTFAELRQYIGSLP